MADKSLQETYVEQLLDPRSALTPRENAAADEIRWLRSQIEGVRESWNAPAPKKSEKVK